MADITVKPNALPLPLVKKISEQPPVNALPLNLNRRLGTSNPATPTEPPAKPTEPRRMMGVAAWFDASVMPAKTVQDCISDTHNGIVIANRYQSTSDTVQGVAGCQYLPSLGFVPLANCKRSITEPVIPLSRCEQALIEQFVPLSNCQRLSTSDTVGYVSCAEVVGAKVVQHHKCVSLAVQSVINYQTGFNHAQASAQVAKQQTSTVQPAIAVPCRYYPIPEITPPPITPVCRLRPPAGRLPLTLTRRRGIHPSHALPLPLLCWHDAIPKIIPNHRSYIVHNVVTANIAGIAINPIAFSIKTDMHSYCWQGSIDITASDYVNIKTKLDTERGKEPLITVNINGFIFAIIAEEHSRRRQFVSHSHTLSGRSITARLGADYAQAQGLLGNHTGLIDQDSYSSQIVQQQLNGLGVQIDRWETADWLIPANVYSITGKTPIAVIADIATAAGGFISSHPHDAKLSLKPRWTKPAWELATATPAVTLPADVIRQIDDSKRVNPRYNTITLTSTTQGGIVYRNGQGRDKDAPTVDNILYTDRDVIVPAGITLLSDSGRHTEYTLTLRWMNKYNLPLAELGQIWQVNDPEGAWRGVVTAVSVQVKLEDDVPTIWQTVNLDRYLDA